ncbi:MAG: tetratricopeptide repeat protein [Phormidesmis sp. RL_2_1]|nr:tetratricopeptide repeat protein [Phormidesmis sp. RL_2_1]
MATPTDLILDKKRTPFNIGQAIQLTGFQIEETEPLRLGLIEHVSDPAAVLRAILHWTGGQPFLTQKVCQLVVQEAARYAETTAPPSEELVEYVVRAYIIDNWEVQDEPPHLKTIRDRIRNNPRAGQLLELYQNIVRRGHIVQDGSPQQVSLRLSGLVVERLGTLQVYNPIYKEVFDLRWSNRTLASIRPYGQQLDEWIAHQQDDRWLLQGSALETALDWAESRSLSKQDYQFLVESQKLGLRSDLAAINGELAQARAELMRVRRRTRLANVLGIGLLSSVAIGIGQYAGTQARAAGAARQETVAAQRQLAEATEAVDNLQGEKADLSHERSRLAQNNQNLAANNQALSTEKEQIAQEVDTAQTAQATAENAATAAKAQATAVQVAAERVRNAAIAAQTEAEQRQNELANVNQELLTKNEELNAVLAETTRLQAQQDEITANLEALGTQLGNALSFSLGTSGLQQSQNALYELGGLQKSIEYLENSLRKAREFKNRRSEGNTLATLGDVYHNLGNYPKALDRHREHLALAQKFKIGQESCRRSAISVRCCTAKVNI